MKGDQHHHDISAFWPPISNLNLSSTRKLKKIVFNRAEEQDLATTNLGLPFKFQFKASGPQPVYYEMFINSGRARIN